jgi:hypothetical protein
LKESRLVWLPLNYGLRPEERDSREDWQRILTDLSGVPFTRGNTIEYLVNEQFHRALLRTIQATRRHHVTVIHDFRGRDADGDGDDDTIGWEVAIDGYLAALTAAVADLDRGGRDRLPEFHLFLDENYYQVNDSRPLMTFLENPWERDPPRLRDAALAARAEAAVAALRRAVRASAACRALPKDALRELLRVHVHVTNPYDPVFASDATMRDHRKLAFRDVDEGDPAAGEAILTGLGVGEKYNGTAWEDRSLLVRGEALVALKDAARELFRSQGYDADEVPPCLRAGPAGAGPPGVPGDWTVPVQLSRNLTGYGKKAATAVKAALYNLLPAGGVLLVPDSLWLSEFWAGMLVGAAARGVDVLVMAPAPENAPSAGMVTLHLLRENLEMMIRAAALLAGDLERAGGSLRVGCYAEDRPVQDLAGRLRTLAGELATHPELAAALSLPPAALAAADSLARLWEPEGVPPPLAPDRARLAAHHPPFLHLKAQLLLGPGARRALAGTDWPALLADYFTVRHAQLRGRDARGIAPALVPDGLDDELPALLLLGSHNQDRRSMLLDGEALATVAGPAALLAAPDLAYLAAATVWARTPAELAAVFPEVDGPGFLKKWFRLLRDLI